MKSILGAAIFLIVALAIFAQVEISSAGAMDDAKSIVSRNSWLSNRALAEKIYTELNRNYPWRNWFVAVYDPVRGAEPHWIGVCGGGHAFRYHGYNLLIASNGADTSHLDRGHASSTLSGAPLYKRGFWGNQKEIYAREIFERVDTELGSMCDDWYAFGVIHHTAQLSVKADWQRLVTTTRLGEQHRGGHRHGYKLFAFK